MDDLMAEQLVLASSSRPERSTGTVLAEVVLFLVLRNGQRKSGPEAEIERATDQLERKVGVKTKPWDPSKGNCKHRGAASGTPLDSRSTKGNMLLVISTRI